MRLVTTATAVSASFFAASINAAGPTVAAVSSAGDASASSAAGVGSVLVPGPPPELARGSAAAASERDRRRNRRRRLQEADASSSSAAGLRGEQRGGRGGRRGLQETYENDTCSGTDWAFTDLQLLEDHLKIDPATNVTAGTGRCIDGWEQSKWYDYPWDFKDSNGEFILSDVRMYTCPNTEKRIILSNGVPDHSTQHGNPHTICEYHRKFTIPLNPVVAPDAPLKEPANFGTVAMALNGVPIFSALEADGGNAVEPGDGRVRDAQYWYGHATRIRQDHYHDPWAGGGKPGQDTLLGYAVDGVPLYGPIEDDYLTSEGLTLDQVLDECNGRYVDNAYRYHVRNKEDVDSSLPYCVDEPNNSPVIAWRYIVGCFKGPIEDTTMEYWDPETFDATTHLDPDCVLESESDLTVPVPPAAEAGYANPRPEAERRQPNFLIVQPDDLQFYNLWGPQPIANEDSQAGIDFPASGLPHLERLRSRSVQMRQAHAASPMCGTSRFSTVTGRYPSRSAENRKKNLKSAVANVVIPNTKLEDVVGEERIPEDAYDCSRDNVAAAIKAGGYRTGMTGKWHLQTVDRENYVYSDAVDAIKACGFDFVDGMYSENLFDEYTNSEFSHNMEWVTEEAIKFISGDYTDDDAEKAKPWLLYYNPTVPHLAANVVDALDAVSCRKTADVNNPLPRDPLVKGMTMDLVVNLTLLDGTNVTKQVEPGSCKEYRTSVKDRAGTITANETQDAFGAIWLDDAIGALLTALEDEGQLDNTMIIFQMDHGMTEKSTLFEGGNRIAQFVHYPEGLGVSGRDFQGLVSTIDIAPTVLDYAGIADHYAMDGESWKAAMDDPVEENRWAHERCLFFEAEQDRAVKCGQCNKYVQIRIENDNGTLAHSETWEYGELYNLGVERAMYTNLCDATTGEYALWPQTSHERNNLILDATTNPDGVKALKNTLDCHKNRTSAQDLAVPDYETQCTQFTDWDGSSFVCGDVGLCPYDSPIGVELTRTCKWINDNSHCGDYHSYCEHTCGICNPENVLNNPTMGCSGSFKCGMCIGDCDHDGHCADGLVCLEREGFEDVPGCEGLGEEAGDYCYPIELAPANQLLTDGDCENSSTGTCGECSGDCDHDAHCDEGYVCFERSKKQHVPGCIGLGVHGKDYCYDINAAPINQLRSLSGGLRALAAGLGECQGSCSADADCEGSLQCFFRSVDGVEEVPGCAGFGEPGTNYCYEPDHVLNDPTDDCSGSSPCAVCKGDCDDDDDCVDGAVCFERDGEEEVPGCSGTGVSGKDYCYSLALAPLPYLEWVADEEEDGFYLECQGDCDHDDDCATGLVCFDRDGLEPVPGCEGLGKSGEDYCYRIELAPANQLRYVADEEENGFYKECEGDCDSDSDCFEHLLCEQRSTGEKGGVNGCAGIGAGDSTDYCYDPTKVLLVPAITCETDATCGVCEGDCDHDGDCDAGLVCFDRSDDEEVPGCGGSGQSGEDYCYDQNLAPADQLITVDGECSATSKCGMCHGDCDHDDHCQEGLVCFERSSIEPVPGCSGYGTAGKDYCYPVELAPPNQLVYIGEKLTDLKECQGDCDEDSDCAGNLECFQRTNNEPVHWCAGLGTAGYDYCYDPDKADVLLFRGEGLTDLDECEGDCDYDSDCVGDLECFQRDTFEPVPGCPGHGLTGHDYCYDPLKEQSSIAWT